jgi:hypothetical protein
MLFAASHDRIRLRRQDSPQDYLDLASQGEWATDERGEEGFVAAAFCASRCTAARRIPLTGRGYAAAADAGTT